MNDTAANLGELTIIRTYDAPRAVVFECMVTPEHLTHFWGPTGVSTPLDRIKIDLQPGGVFETVMVNDSDGNEYTSRGVYVEIVEPSKLVWSESDVEGGMTTSVTFVDLGDDRTEVTIHQTNVPEMYLSPEAQTGFKSSLDRFAEYVSSL
jgi:uncharacterized protein YndB with AHSA1/START domain